MWPSGTLSYIILKQAHKRESPGLKPHLMSNGFENYFSILTELMVVLNVVETDIASNRQLLSVLSKVQYF